MSELIDPEENLTTSHMFSAKQSTLLEALDKITSAIEGSVPLSNIYACILFKQTGTKLEMTASDSQVQITTSCEVKVEGKESGQAFAANARKFRDILRSLGDSTLKFKRENEKNLIITSGRSNRFQLALRDGGDFPRITVDGKTDLETKLAQIQLKELLDFTHAAVSHQSHRIYLAGAYFDFLDDGLHIVATDGHRLATGVIPDAKAKDVNFILPRKALLALRRLLKKDGETQIQLSGQKEKDIFRVVSFTTPTLELNCVLIQGQYPNYSRVIPDLKDNDIHCQFKLTELQGGVRQVCAVHDKSGEGIKLDYTGKGGNLDLSAKSTDSPDEAQVSVAMTEEGSKAYKCLLNSSYLQDLLDAFSDHPEIRFAFKDEQGSVLCVPPKDTPSKLQYVVMPMR